MATLSSDVSAAFSLKVPPDHFYNPFGEPSLLEPEWRTKALEPRMCFLEGGPGTPAPLRPPLCSS